MHYYQLSPLIAGQHQIKRSDSFVAQTVTRRGGVYGDHLEAASCIIAAKFLAFGVFLRFTDRSPGRRLSIICCRLALGPNFIKQRLKLHVNIVANVGAAPAGLDGRNGRLVDAGATLDFQLRQSALREFLDDVGCIHGKNHSIAFVLDLQVPMRLHDLIHSQYENFRR